MGEMAQALKLLGGGLPTCIQKITTACPLQGKYHLVGRIPGELSTLVTRKHTPQIPPLRESMVWDTEEDAIAALLAVGVTTFQRADYSQYTIPSTVVHQGV